MQFLKTLFWVVLAVAAVIFAMRNWVPATVNLWGGLLVEAKLPVLIYGAFLAGLLPMFFYHRAARWQLRRRLASQQRALADIQATEVVAPASTTPPVVVPADPAAEPPAQS
ncbi:lipopolysaccharide assembly protein LapA domain-containing protein [Sphingomonas sp.]|uniref:lipopolysaccharide assembly protein LapA domain-containing protein n=1 Tax=Sphingomonas sp. TaxID=28214 RepID=UPI003B0076CC